MFLALCMIVSMLPVSAMAEEIHTTVGGSGEIISFAPLTETEKMVSLGTSIEDLELPETLTATVRTAVPADENPMQDSGSPQTATPTTATEPQWEETTVEIPVTWGSPGYDRNTEGEYVFTPVVEIYTASAPLPEIVVTVGEMPPIAAPRGLVTPMSTTTYDIWVGGVRVTSDNKADVLGAADGEGATVTYNSDTNTLTLNGATINGTYEGTWIGSDTTAYYGIYADIALKIDMVGDSTVMGKNLANIASIGIYTGSTLNLSGSGSLYVSGGTGKFSVGIYSAGSIAIEGGRVTAASVAATQTSIAIASNGDITISNEGVEASANTSAPNSYGMMATNSFTINDGEVTASGKTGLHTNAAEGPVTISGGKLTANGSQVGIAGAVAVTDGTVTVKSDTQALNGILTTSGYEECSVTASANKNGTPAVSYDAANLASYKYIKVEPGAAGTTAPTVTSVTVPGNGTYTTGQTLNFTVNFDEKVTVNTSSGTPYLSLIIGSTSRQATYVSGSGASNLVFRYTVQAGDSDSNGISIGSLILNGGTIQDGAGNNANLTLNSVGNMTGVLVDTSAAPSITSQPSTQTVNEGQSATFSVAATGTGLTYQWQVDTGSGFTNISNGGVYSGANTSTLTITGATAGMSGYQYRAVVSGMVSPAATSNSAMLTVNSATYTISGTIKGSDTGSGISGASVWLKNGSGPVGTPVLTDANGDYTISNVSAGTYSIDAGALNYYLGTISSVTVSANVTGKDLTLTSIMIFTPVTEITMTNASSVQVGSDLTLTGIVYPLNATNQSIVWSIENANGTGATVAGGTFRATSAGTATVKATITNGSTASSDYTKTFDITVTTIPVVTNIITATTSTGGSISPSGSVTVSRGTSKTFTITPASNYSIADVKVDGVSQGRITSYTFSNVTANHTISATFSYSGSSDGGSSSNDNSSPVVVTPPTLDKPNSPTQGETKVSGTVDSNGNVTVNITGKAVADVFDKAMAEAKKNGTEQNGITMVLRVDTGNKTGSSVTVNLPKFAQDTIIAKKIVNTIVVVDNPDIRIGMDLATVQEINKQAKSDVNIAATRTDSGKLTGDAKKAIGSRPVFDLKVNYGNGKAVSSFGAGSVSVTIPYTLGANENAGNVQAVYVDAKGKVHWLTNSVYDSVEKVLRFSTNHFSTYGIGYKQANTAFTDIAGHWAKEDIEFVVSRGLFSGTSETKFSPNAAMTRGMFVTVLGRLASADVSGYAKSSFSDVKSDAYYMGYIEWASKNNIVNGVGNGRFAPNQSITREQMAVIMSNYAKTIGYTLPKVHVENTFADNGKISAYAKEAVKQMQMAGVISGKNGNLFDPQGTATRAEVSAVLRRFVELAISNDTAQGWTMNDSGKWMYFKDGKPLTGKQDIDGGAYTFDQYGVTADVPKNLRYTTYIVQKGDSFWLIAHKLGCTMSELERLNNKSRFSIIYPGDVLRVPEK